MKIRGIGIDAVSIERIDIRRMGEYVIRRLFHPIEVSYATESSRQASEYLASRFAAKEALVKALGTGFRGIAPCEIAVDVDEQGKPFFLLSQEIKKRLRIEEMDIHLSLTHEGGLALAFVVLEEREDTYGKS